MIINEVVWRPAEARAAVCPPLFHRVQMRSGTASGLTWTARSCRVIRAVGVELDHVQAGSRVSVALEKWRQSVMLTERSVFQLVPLNPPDLFLS